ncbi:MAG: peptidogalycan biosysnthesis protein, partial [Gammaproteobacteria bacterium]|nr:peptidogalycan biosysnthesis protein [Gammaproteobacteria bacterium]
MALQLRIITSLTEVKAEQWDALCDEENFFLSHGFLLALEQTGCLEPFGWLPHYFLLCDDNNQLIAAVPSYIKTNSYGEFVFDWAWADAYQRSGLEYYPKLVVGSPYTPVGGQRLLCAPERLPELLPVMQKALLQFCQQQNMTGLHWLFCTE